MPTTQPLDEDDLGDDFEGRLKPIAEFAQQQKATAGEASRTSVNVSSTRSVPQSQPQPAPKMRTPSSTITTSRGALHMEGMRTPGIGLGGLVKKTSDSKNESATSPTTNDVAPKREASYTDKDVQMAWERFIGTHAAEHLLTNAMRVAKPTRLQGDTFVVAQSKIHLGYISENLLRLTQYVREIVNNDNVEFELKEISEDSPLAWSDQNLVKHMVENNPALGDFITTLKLKLL